MVKNKRRLDELSELLKNPPHNLWVDVYNEDIKVIKEPGVKNPNKEKMTLAKLAKQMNDGFKQVNGRLDKVEARLDRVEARLDRVELHLDRVEKRLDYNNLKKLPSNK